MAVASRAARAISRPLQVGQHAPFQGPLPVASASARWDKWASERVRFSRTCVRRFRSWNSRTSCYGRRPRPSPHSRPVQRMRCPPTTYDPHSDGCNTSQHWSPARPPPSCTRPAARDLPHDDGAASTVAWLRDILRIPTTDASRMITLGQLIDQRPTIAAAVELRHGQPGPSLDDRPRTRRHRAGRTSASSTKSRRSSSTTPPSSNRRSCDASANAYSPTSAPTAPTRVSATSSTAKNDTPANAEASHSHRTDSAAPASAASSTPKAPPSSRPPSNRWPDQSVTTTAPTYAPHRPAAPTPWSRYAASRWPPVAYPTPAEHHPSSTSPSTSTHSHARLPSASSTPARCSPHPRRVASHAKRRSSQQCWTDTACRSTSDAPGDRSPAPPARRSSCATAAAPSPAAIDPAAGVTSTTSQFWAHGGRTDRDNGVALCSLSPPTHPPKPMDIRMGADHRPEFIPPAHLDPQRRPRRNPYHPRP